MNPANPTSGQGVVPVIQADRVREAVAVKAITGGLYEHISGRYGVTWEGVDLPEEYSQRALAMAHLSRLRADAILAIATPPERGELASLVEAVQNASGFLDNAVMRRRYASDDFYEPVVASIRAALAKLSASSVGGGKGDGSLSSGKCTCSGNDPWCDLCRSSERRIPTSREVMIAGGVDPDAPFEVGPFPAEMRQAAPVGDAHRGWVITWDYGFYTATSPNYDASYEGEEDGWVDNGQRVTARTRDGVIAEIDNWFEEQSV